MQAPSLSLSPCIRAPVPGNAVRDPLGILQHNVPNLFQTDIVLLKGFDDCPINRFLRYFHFSIHWIVRAMVVNRNHNVTLELKTATLVTCRILSHT